MKIRDRLPLLRILLICLSLVQSVQLGASMSLPVTPSTTNPPSSMSLSLGGIPLRQAVIECAHLDNEATLDVSGILWMEHLNLVVGDKALAEDFYTQVLGCTRDTGKSFHVNLGQQQFHLAENGDPAQIVSGSIGLTVPSLDSLRGRVTNALAKEAYSTSLLSILSDQDNCLSLQCPWGNTFHIYSVVDDPDLASSSPLATPMKMVNLHSEGGSYGAHRMAVRGQPGIRFVEVACPPGKSPAVARFYREMMGCTVQEIECQGQSSAMVCVGPGVHVAFVEQKYDIPQAVTSAMEGVHICFYADNFQNLYDRLAAKGLIWTNPRFLHLDSCDTWEEARASRTLRFKDVIDLETGEKILELEHETRPQRHGQYLKVPKYEPRLS